MPTTLLTLTILAIVIVLVFEYTNGFHDAANIIATVITSRAMTPVQAVMIVGFFEFLGPLPGGTADNFMRDISRHIKEGVDALANGFAKLGSTPATASLDADEARKAERHAEKLYRVALPILFDGSDYINMFKRREIYRHLTNAAENMALCANRLH